MTDAIQVQLCICLCPNINVGFLVSSDLLSTPTQIKRSQCSVFDKAKGAPGGDVGVKVESQLRSSKQFLPLWDPFNSPRANWGLQLGLA